MSFEDFIDSLPTEIEGPRARKIEERFTCGQCGGTGKWSGGTNRHGNSNCLACKGRGYFTTSPKFRQEQRAKVQAKKQAAADELRRSIKLFAEENPAMYEDLCAGRTDFTRSLYQQLMQRGTLTVNQIAAWNRGWEKLQAIKAERAKAVADKGGVVDLSRIREMFDAAIASGYKKPVYRAEGLKIKMAYALGRNAGALDVIEIEDDTYQGNIKGVTFNARRDTKADVLSRLQTIAADPMAAAVSYGRRTGTCACCGRELTNHASIDAGIGPICASKWGL